MPRPTTAHAGTIADKTIDELTHALRRGRYDAAPPSALAKRVAETLIQTVATAPRDASAEDIIARVREVGGALALVRREHLLVGNVARRVLKVIRDEASAGARGRGAEARAGSGERAGSGVVGGVSGGGDRGGERGERGEREDGVDGHGRRSSDGGEAMKKLKRDVIETAHEVMEEMQSVSSNIAAQSGEFVVNGMVIMTISGAGGASGGLPEAFLRDAHKKRSDLRVVVAECAPRFDGHVMAKSLAERGVKDVNVICDSAVYAAMPSVKLVVLSARGVLADGTALVDSGAYNVALAAKAHAVPVIVLAGSYAISPKSINEEGFDSLFGLGSPASALEYGVHPDAVVVNPALEYVPPELISVFVTDHGAHVPGFIQVLLGEMYSPLDASLLAK